MSYEDILNKEREYFEAKIKSADKKEMQFLSGKDSFRGKCFGFMTSNYYKRGKLIKEGQLIYGYTFKMWTNNTDLSKPYPTWVLFSPDKTFSNNPDLYKIISSNILEFVEKENNNKEFRHFITLIKEPLAEPCYLEVPLFLSENKLVYISLVYIRPKQLPSFHIGLNLFIMNQQISKELLYLPEKYFIEDFKKIY